MSLFYLFYTILNSVLSRGINFKKRKLRYRTDPTTQSRGPLKAPYSEKRRLIAKASLEEPLIMSSLKL